MRALITGAGGFVGPWLEAHLRAQGDAVVAADLESDVTDASRMAALVASAQPEVVYHLAARTHVGESWLDPVGVVEVNVLGTAVVLAAARRLDPMPRVLVVSSAEVYGALDDDDLPVSEEAPLRPVSPYAASKAAAEQVALGAWRGFGQPVIVARPFNHVGPGQSTAFVVPALAHRVVEARRHGTAALSVGNVETRRDFTDVRDVVRAYRLLAVGGSPGHVYNVCRGRDVSVAELCQELMALAGIDLPLAVDPVLVRAVDTPVVRGDPSRIRAQTGWSPVIDLDATLAEVLAEAEAQSEGGVSR